MRFVYQRKGGPLLNWDRNRAPGWATGSGRSADARALGSVDLIPKAGGPEVVTAVGDYVEMGDYQEMGDMPDTMTMIRIAGAAAAGYHGYKRNGDSATWGLVWAGLGGLVSPLITNVVAVVQGYGKKKGS